MKKHTLKSNLDDFQDSTINIDRQNASTGGYFNLTFNRSGQIDKVMMGNVVLFECCGNGNGVW